MDAFKPIIAKVAAGSPLSREEAEHALEKAAERNQEWDDDPTWND